MQSKEQTPNWDLEEASVEDIPVEVSPKEDIPVEVIEPQTDAAYNVNITRLKTEAEKEIVDTGNANLMPLVNNMQVQGFKEDEIKAVVVDVTISGALRNEMAAPSTIYSAGDKVLNNAQAIGRVLVEKAVSGDMQAIREVLNRTEGKVPTTNYNKNMSVNVKGDANSIAALMGKIDANK